MIRASNIQKSFRTPQGEVAALRGVDLDVSPGEMVTIRGPSGSGKSTLLLTLGGMLRPSAGRVEVAECDPYDLSGREAARLRSQHIGFIFQMFHLVPYLDVRRNILMGARNLESDEASERVDHLIGSMGLSHRVHHRPAQLSAGERQRVAVARALVHRPGVVLADEPTGNLDPENAAEVFRHLGAWRDQGGAVVVVTHGEKADSHSDRILELRDGRFSHQAGLANGWGLVLASLLALLTLIGLLYWNAHDPMTGDDVSELRVWCAAGIRPPVEEIARMYREEQGISIRLEYAGTRALLSKLRVAAKGDLFIAADDSFLDLARRDNLVAETVPLARIRPVLAVRKGNPKNILDLEDLLRKDLSFGLASPDSAAIGTVVMDRLMELGSWEDLSRRCRVMKPTVMDVANDVKMGALDAGILWNATVNQYDEIEAIPLPEFSATTQTISVGILTCTRAPTAALRFARYLGARDRGLPRFSALGYDPVDGDQWEIKPRLVLFSGAMLRPGLDATINRFENREGCEIRRVYDGCGNLVSRMRTGERPDAYVSCDVSFMKMVEGMFDKPHDLTKNDMVILVTAGNPKGIRGLGDLGKPGLKVGLGHPEYSALGTLTDRLLRSSGVHDAVSLNKKTETPTGDMLVNQLRSGSLDAVIVYRSNAMSHPGHEKHYEIVPLNPSNAMAVQSYAISANALHGNLLQRMFAAITSDTSRTRFEGLGFRWHTGTTR